MKRLLSLLLIAIMIGNSLPAVSFASIADTIRNAKAYDGDPADPSLLMNQGLIR